MIDRNHDLPLVRQAELLRLSRSTLYYEPQPVPLCQRSCRLNRIGTFGGADSRKWLDTDKRTKIG